MFKPLIENVFLSDESRPELHKCIFVLYRFSGEQGFLKWEETIKKHPLFVDKYDPDKKHVMLVMKLPPEHYLDYINFKESKYSNLNSSYKQKILTYHRVGKEHPLYHILHRTEEGYRALERDVGQPVDRGTEIGTLVDIKGLERYSKELHHTEVITPNEDFHTPKPFNFNTRED